MPEIIQITNLSLSDFENIIRRVVREENARVREIQEDRMITRKEVMKYLGKSYPTVCRMIYKGMIPEYHNGHGAHPRYKLSEIMELEDKQRERIQQRLKRT